MHKIEGGNSKALLDPTNTELPGRSKKYTFGFLPSLAKNPRFVCFLEESILVKFLSFFGWPPIIFPGHLGKWTLCWIYFVQTFRIFVSPLDNFQGFFANRGDLWNELNCFRKRGSIISMRMRQAIMRRILLRIIKRIIRKIRTIIR